MKKRPRFRLRHCLPLLWLLGGAVHAAETGAESGLFVTREGPWGRLQCYPFYLEAPDTVVALVPLPDTQPRWQVPELKHRQQRWGRSCPVRLPCSSHCVRPNGMYWS